MTGYETRNFIATFGDTPEIGQLEAVLGGWRRPEMPARLKDLLKVAEGLNFLTLCRAVRESLANGQNRRYKRQLEVSVIGWLYAFIRSNVKRGREFDLRRVLEQGSADCLGYAKLFILLGRLAGLDVGVIEVVRDNGGRLVPHTAVMVKLSAGGLRFIDLWYGSPNIRHKRVGLHVKRGEIWRIEDVTLRELAGLEAVCYLPDACVDAITLYIIGNRYLKGQEFDSAIGCYTRALELYPDNSRFLYNRAIAYDKLGEYERAGADYAQALRSDAAITRLLAKEHDEVTSLLQLDAQEVDSLAQEVYLLYKGFITGSKVTPAVIAMRFGLSEAETKAILSSVEAKLD